MSNVLLEYLLNNPGKADFLDLGTGTVYHTGGFGKEFGFIPTTNVFTGKQGAVVVQKKETHDMSDERRIFLEDIIERYNANRDKYDHYWDGIENTGEKSYVGKFVYNGIAYFIEISDGWALSRLVNKRDAITLNRAMKVVTVRDVTHEELKAFITLRCCAAF